MHLISRARLDWPARLLLFISEHSVSMVIHHIGDGVLTILSIEVSTHADVGDIVDSIVVHTDTLRQTGCCFNSHYPS